MHGDHMNSMREGVLRCGEHCVSAAMMRPLGGS
jgi:hypothetical protein